MLTGWQRRVPWRRVDCNADKARRAQGFHSFAAQLYALIKSSNGSYGIVQELVNVTNKARQGREGGSWFLCKPRRERNYLRCCHCSCCRRRCCRCRRRCCRCRRGRRRCRRHSNSSRLYRVDSSSSFYPCSTSISSYQTRTCVFTFTRFSRQGTWETKKSARMHACAHMVLNATQDAQHERSYPPATSITGLPLSSPVALRPSTSLILVASCTATLRQTIS